MPEGFTNLLYVISAVRTFIQGKNKENNNLKKEEEELALDSQKE